MKISGKVIQDRNIKVFDENTFIGTYKNCHIICTTDHGHGSAKYPWLKRFDITVTCSKGTYLVNTFEDYHTVRDAIRNALIGAMLLKIDKY